jgi:hypothetical protein
MELRLATRIKSTWVKHFRILPYIDVVVKVVNVDGDWHSFGQMLAYENIV